MASSTFVVEEIHCGACEAAIGKALTRMDGVQGVSANSATNQVAVRFDESQTTGEAIAQRLAAAGYPVVAGGDRGPDLEGRAGR
ncbi:copper chaperone [Modestobacter sp. DSM 44400]|uniref:heavy-metal-associated domain-containing protein n=1 Tax=Modestobacter sp. DSM 44400 TaxID=1550230 RepID=UPI0008970ED4|nr:heavy-metal-associated domain-containing protein [Modestobacter sp. DSM 44400]SDY78522.1 copper chaperone [Modestobacter sp. DSM 44400]